MATAPVTLQPNFVTPLMIHRIIGKHVMVTAGTLNILVGERLHTVHAGESLHIPQGTPFAMANLSGGFSRFEETHDPMTFAHDVTIVAYMDGRVMAEPLSPALQAVYSVYDSVCGMLIDDVMMLKAA